MSKLIAVAGVASRRKAADLIRAGRVWVDGRPATNPALEVDPSTSTVEVDGCRVEIEPKVYFLLNKPAGTLSTASDSRGRQTVLDLLGARAERLYPAGRLDIDTEGVLLITNDGALTYLLTHPRYEVEKVYEAEVRAHPKPRAIERLREGVVLEDGPTGPARVRLLWKKKDTSLLELTIHSGRKRQVRRMLEAVGHAVVALRRTRVGPLTLGDLKPGQWRELTDKEVTLLRSEAEKKAARRERTADTKRG